MIHDGRCDRHADEGSSSSTLGLSFLPEPGVNRLQKTDGRRVFQRGWRHGWIGRDREF